MAKMSLSRSLSTGGKKTQTRAPVRSNAKKPRTASAPVVRSRPQPISERPSSSTKKAQTSRDNTSSQGTQVRTAPRATAAPRDNRTAGIQQAAARALTSNTKTTLPPNPLGIKIGKSPLSNLPLKGTTSVGQSIENTPIPSTPKGFNGGVLPSDGGVPSGAEVFTPRPVAGQVQAPEVTAPTAPRPVAPVPQVTAPGSGVGTGGGQFSTVGRSGIGNGPFGLLQRMRQSRGPLTGPSITPELLRRIAARQFSR